MPEVTVSMPAHDAGRFIDQAIASVLDQSGVDLELFVVDDASTDDTAARLERFSDERLHVLRNPRRRGIGFSHNCVLERSSAPFIAHVDADDFLLPGALRQMVDALIARPAAAQAHCLYVTVDELGRPSRENIRSRWKRMKMIATGEVDYRRLTIHNGGAINHLRTYRRSVLEELGGFDPTLPFAVDYEMALRILEHHEIVAVPRVLYCWRRHRRNSSEGGRFRLLRRRLLQHRLHRRLISEGRVTYLPNARFPWREILRNEPRRRWRRWLARWTAHTRRAKRRIQYGIVPPVRRRLQMLLRAWLRRGSPAVRVRAAAATETHPIVLYYLWNFPALSQTFIQREIRALMEAGVTVHVAAHQAEGAEHFDALARELAASTHYVGRRVPGTHRFLRAFAFRHPLTVARAACEIIAMPYARKTPSRDRELLGHAVRLALIARELGATRLHSPWAGQTAIAAGVAAHILGIPLSVQARAYDVYDRSELIGLRERLRPASFLVTNTRANERHLLDTLGGDAPPICVIHNGVDLQRFPIDRSARREGPVRTLCVARLVEQKGIEYLLEAVARLRGTVALECRIIGGRGSISYDLELRKLLRRLALSDSVTIEGARSFDDVQAAYRWSDIVVLPAVVAADGRRDVTPNVLIEAMAAERPVIGTPVAGIPELIEDEVTGLLVEPRDAIALSGAIARLAADEQLRVHMGAAGRRRVEDLFDIGKNIRSFAALFRGEGAP